MVRNTAARMGFWAAASLAILSSIGCGSGTGTGTGTGTGVSGGANDIGHPCNVLTDAGASSATYNASASECPSHLCLKPMTQVGSYAMTGEGSTCSAECTQDSDCEGELRDPTDPNDTRCSRGFTCAIPLAVGPLCCKKLCVCKDYLAQAGATTPSACDAAHGNGAGCWQGSGSTPTGSLTGVVQETDLQMLIAPNRQLDLVVMIDNSPTMATKVQKLNEQFPKLIGALKNPVDNALPDLRVAIIDSDLGTGGRYLSGSCGPNARNGGSNFGDQGHFQMINAKSCGVTVDDAQWLEFANGRPVNYTGDINTVFACLANGVGTLGCAEEHQLQAFEFALVAKGVGNDEQQRNFLRPSAGLVLVFLSDEDDCSAALNDGMFGDLESLKNESGSLRCATRAHTCNGKNLTDAPPGYPTTAAFSAPFTNCQARTADADQCPNIVDGASSGTDTSVPTACNPLKSIHRLAAEIKSLKGNPDDQILVAGIFGWPLTNEDMATATYKIDQIPNPNTADTTHPQIYDYWPVCYDPGHPAPLDGSYDASAFGMGATGGLRMSAFIDEFGSNGLKFSICQPDFGDSMQKIGGAIYKGWQGMLCVNYKLMDVDLDTPGLQPDCRVAYRIPTLQTDNSNTIVMKESDRLPMCPDGATYGNVDEDCWQLVNDPIVCPANGQWITVLRTKGEVEAGPLTPGTRLNIQCLTCPDDIPGEPITSDRYRACHY